MKVKTYTIQVSLTEEEEKFMHDYFIKNSVVEDKHLVSFRDILELWVREMLEEDLASKDFDPINAISEDYFKEG